MIKPIETVYKGYRFRSRLEARWAVFFDACGVKWEYEPEGYDLGDGLWYLPDFLLHNVEINHGVHAYGVDLFVEVKGVMAETDLKKIDRFYNLGSPTIMLDDQPSDDYMFVSKTPILVVGTPEGADIDEMVNLAFDKPEPFYNFETIDGDCFGAFPGVNVDGNFCLFGADHSYFESMDREKTLRAYLLARQARFEHGETPKED